MFIFNYAPFLALPMMIFFAWVISNRQTSVEQGDSFDAQKETLVHLSWFCSVLLASTLIFLVVCYFFDIVD